MHASGAIATYTHADGKIGVMVEVMCGSDLVAEGEAFQAFIHEIAMQIAAADPRFIRKANVPSEIVAQERERYRLLAAELHRPSHVVEKIVEGKVAKLYDEICLYEQPFIKDPSISISDLVKSKSRELGERLVSRRCARFKLRDGSYSVAVDAGWQSDQGDEPGILSPGRVPPKSGSGSTGALPGADHR
jgi:elongation factor Ts